MRLLVFGWIENKRGSYVKGTARSRARDICSFGASHATGEMFSKVYPQELCYDLHWMTNILCPRTPSATASHSCCSWLVLILAAPRRLPCPPLQGCPTPRPTHLRSWTGYERPQQACFVFVAPRCLERHPLARTIAREQPPPCSRPTVA